MGSLLHPIKDMREGQLFQVIGSYSLPTQKCRKWPFSVYGWHPPEGCYDPETRRSIPAGDVLLLIDILEACHEGNPCAQTYVYLVLLWKEERVYISYQWDRWNNEGKIDFSSLELIKNKGSQ